MHILIINILRGVKKRLLQYIGIVILIVIVVASISGLYANGDRVASAFYQVEAHSGSYDYRISSRNLSGYRDSNDALGNVIKIIMEQFQPLFVKDHAEYLKIKSQVEALTVNNIEKNSLPSVSKGDTINPLLLEYLMNWNVNYFNILMNNILNTTVKTDPLTEKYQIAKSFLKTFDARNDSNKLFFSFEDAFLYSLPDKLNPPATTNFDFTPDRDGFNKVYITQGTMPKAENEVVINPDFASANKIRLNSRYEFLAGQPLKVVGFGYTYWGVTGARSIDNIDPKPSNTTQIFTSRAWINDYLENNSYASNKQTQFFLKVNNKDSFFATRLEAIFNKTFNFDYGNLIISDSDDLRGGALKQNFSMQNIVFAAIAIVVLMVLIFIVLSYVRKEILLQKKQIGLIKALGYKNNEISTGFTILFLLLTIFAAIIGFLLSLPLQLEFNSLLTLGFFLPLPILHFSLINLLIVVVIVPVIFTIAAYTQAMASLRIDTLVLVYDKPSNSSSKWVAFFKKPFSYWSFRPRLAISFALKSFGKLVLIFFIFIFVSFLLLFQSIATDTFGNKIDNLYNTINHDVYSTSATADMFTTNQSGQKTQIFDWTLDKDLDPNKEITSATFILTEAKYHNLIALFTTGNLKGYYITSPQMNLLYENTQPGGLTQAFNYITSNHSSDITDQQAEQVAENLQAFFIFLISNTNGVTTNLPGISVGQNVINNNYFPNLQFFGNAPAQWIGHSQGPLKSKFINIVTLYNSANPDNPIAWKNWFNFKEEKHRDVDPIFNAAHDLKTETITYVDNFGQKQSVANCVIIPAAISKNLASLNNYQVGDQFLSLFNINDQFIPILFEVQGIIVNNLDNSVAYCNIDDVRTAIGYVSATGIPLANTFNRVYAKDQNISPLNMIDIAQTENQYDATSLQNGFIIINKSPLIYSLVKELFVKVFSGIQSIITITKWLTLFGLLFVLIIIINMILDNNLLIIAMMKSLGYRINEINVLIIGSYILALILAYILGTVLSYGVWNIIVLIVSNLAGTILLVPISAATILTMFGLVFLVLTIGYISSLYFIKFKSVTSLLQSE